MAVAVAAAGISPPRQSVFSIPLDFLVVAFIAAGGLALSAATLVLTEYDWLAAVQLG